MLIPEKLLEARLSETMFRCCFHPIPSTTYTCLQVGTVLLQAKLVRVIQPKKRLSSHSLYIYFI